MNNQERQIMTNLCRIEIRRWQAVPDKQYLVDLLGLALAALTAGLVKVPDAALNGQCQFLGDKEPYYNRGWNDCRAEVLLLNAVPPVQGSEVAEVARAALDYIDALPSEVVASLPAMPGLDRDWAERVLKNETD